MVVHVGESNDRPSIFLMDAFGRLAESLSVGAADSVVLALTCNSNPLYLGKALNGSPLPAGRLSAY